LNERLGEHYRRLEYARINFRRYVVGDSWYELDQKINSRSRTGNEYIGRYQTNALPEDRELDDMGIIYVRHGDPDNFMTHFCFGCDQNFSWHYFEKYNLPEMIFHFAKGGQTRGWIITASPLYFNNRYELGPDYARMDPEISRISYLNFIDLKEKLATENEQYVEAGLHTERSSYLFHKDALDIPLNVLTFKGEAGKSLVELYYGIDGTQVDIEKTSTEIRLNMSSFLGVYDEEWHEVSRENNQHIKSLGNISEEEWSESSIVSMHNFNVLPGTYNIEFHLNDNISGRLGVFKGSLDVVNYHTDSLMLSDVVLAREIIPGDESTGFKKGDISFDPHMFYDFSQNKVIGIYFEVYNLSTSSDDLTNFELSYTFQPEGANEEPGFFESLLSGEEGIITLTHTIQGYDQDEKIFYNLDTRNIDTGEYELIINVEDLISGGRSYKIMNINIL
jgi:hypothetical protein